MAIWEQPDLLSGTIDVSGVGGAKPEVAVGILHTGEVTMEWAMRTSLVFMHFQTMKKNFVYLCSKNAPYDVSRETIARAALDSGCKYLFFLDSVPRYTPVLIRDPVTKIIDIKPISELAKFDSNTLERVNPIYPYEVFENSDRWCKIKKVIRHPFKGYLKRINCQAGFIDITPNHSIYKFGQGSGECLADASELKIGEHLIFPRVGGWQKRSNKQRTDEGLYYFGDEELAWLHGFFVAEGSISSKISDLSISNTKEELLQKAKEIFESNYNVKMCHIDGQGGKYVSKIEITNKKLAHHLFPSFYTATRDKRIPQEILNAPDRIVDSFLEGFLDGDGHRYDAGTRCYSNNSQVVQSGIIFLLKRKGHNYSTYTRTDKPKAIEIAENVRTDAWYEEMLQLREKAIQLRKKQGWGARKISRAIGCAEQTIHGWLSYNRIPRRRTIPSEIKKIVDIPYSGYVYDLATETQRFSAGVGFNLVHNSDVLCPVNTVEVLMDWSKRFNAPVISGLYWAKKPGPKMPCAWLKVGEHPESNTIDFLPVDIAPHLDTQHIIPVDVTGAGCLLIDTDILRRLDKSNSNLPFFQWGVGRRDEHGKNLLNLSEDFFFHIRCNRELGIKPALAVAVKCDHIVTCIKRGSDGEYELSTRI